MKSVLARGGGEWVAWGGSGKEWHQLWVNHRRSNSALVMRSPPQQHQQVPSEKLWGQVHPSEKGGLKPAHLPQMLLLLLRACARAFAPAPRSPLSRRSSRLT